MSNTNNMKKALNCTIKSPVNLAVGEIKVDMLCGCKVIDITFPNIMSPELIHYKTTPSWDPRIRNVAVRLVPPMQVGEIRFKNYYVATLTVKAKFRTDQTPREAGGEHQAPKWRTCLKRVKLMPDPHSEAGSHDFFSFTNRHFRCELSNVNALRLILQQSSPVWREFKLEDLRLFRSAGGPKVSPLPSWLMDEPKDKFSKKTVEGVADLEGLSANLQQLWALAEEVATNQTSKSLGRFEVDGCYDINLLAYT